MSIIAILQSVASNPIARVALEGVGARAANTFGIAATNAALGLLSKFGDKSVDELHAWVDSFEASHPGVAEAISKVRAACENIIHVPTEDQIFAALKYQVGAIVASVKVEQPDGAQKAEAAAS